MSSPPSTPAPAASRDQRAAEVLSGRGPDRRGGQRNRSDHRRQARSSACSGRTAREDNDPAHPHHAAAGECPPAASPALTFWREPAAVRRRIGYVSQLGGADKSATGRENLLLAGRLYGLSAADAARRCDELARGLRPQRADHPVRPHLLGRSAPSAGGGARHHAPALACSSSTSRPPALTRRTAPTCGSAPPAPRPRARRSASPRTTWTRPTNCATGWRSSIMGGSSRSAPLTSSRAATRPTRSRSRPMSPGPVCPRWRGNWRTPHPPRRVLPRAGPSG